MSEMYDAPEEDPLSDRSPQPQPGSARPRLDGSGDVDVDDVLAAFNEMQRQTAAIVKIVAADIGIGTTDLQALVFLTGNDAVTPKQLSEHLELSTGATTSLVDRMDAAGHVHRVPHPTDRRSTLVELAPAGREAISGVAGFYAQAFREAVDPFYLDFLTTSFRAIGAAVTRHAAERYGERA